MQWTVIKRCAHLCDLAQGEKLDILNNLRRLPLVTAQIKNHYSVVDYRDMVIVVFRDDTGFWHFEPFGSNVATIDDALANSLREGWQEKVSLMTQFRERPVYLTGHGMGAALALAAARPDHDEQVITFGMAEKVALQAVKGLSPDLVQSSRVVSIQNTYDPVPSQVFADAFAANRKMVPLNSATAVAPTINHSFAVNSIKTCVVSGMELSSEALLQKVPEMVEHTSQRYFELTTEAARERNLEKVEHEKKALPRPNVPARPSIGLDDILGDLDGGVLAAPAVFSSASPTIPIRPK